jgi:hypothetical protein
VQTETYYIHLHCRTFQLQILRQQCVLLVLVFSSTYVSIDNVKETRPFRIDQLAVAVNNTRILWRFYDADNTTHLSVQV